MIRQLSKISLILLLLVACFPVRDITTTNMASVYRTTDQYFHPEFLPHIINDTQVTLYINLAPNEFLFVRQDDQSFRASVSIYAEVISSYEITDIVDSATAIFTFELIEKENQKVVSMKLPIDSAGTFLIKCTVKDLMKGNKEEYFVFLDKLSKPSRNEFLVSNKSGRPLFRNYFDQDDTVKIIYRDSMIDNFYCKFYKRDFLLAPPPFTFDVRDEFNYHPDSFFSLNKNQMSQFTLAQEGFYHIQIDSTTKAGLTLFRYTNGFPDVTNPKQMIESIRYLTNKKEFEELKASPSLKSAIDNFWLTHGGNEEKTRLLIKKYYGRVREANKFFTSYTEGWRTDRGMIYVIFGSPGTIYRSNESESWIYGTPNSSLALNFFFVKVNNPFTENDFSLSRSPTYESNWYRAIEIWRQGRAYNSFY